MRKYFYLPLAIILGILVASCSDTTTNPPPVTDTGSIFISSSPANAQISVDGTNTGKVTPDSVTGLSTGNHSVALSLDGYRDTTITLNVLVNQQSTKFVSLTSTLSTTLYPPVTIWETAGTDPVTQPSGLDLSTGMAYGVSGANKNLVDIYYSTSGTGGQGYLVQSADLNTSQGLTRQTKFYIGNGTNIADSVDSPNSALAGWTNHMGDRESNYVFLYDEDGHYSKLIITDFGGGSGGNPAWVKVQWLYNNTGADRRF
jgi:hypothetical protein